jgi:cystathionine gamma-synthase
MAATSAVLQSVPAGSHVLLPRDVYHGTRVFAQEYFGARGVTHAHVDLTDLAALEAAWRPGTALVWIETPSNPLIEVVDIEAVAAFAHARGAAVGVDSTFASPALQNPLALGADVVMHSTTKYLGGHSDVMGGALVFRERGERYERAELARTLQGAVMSPFNAWLTLRGLRTLACRVDRHCANAQAVAGFLATQRAVARVRYPGLPSHPQHAVAKRQMRGFGGMLSIELAGGREAALALASRVRLFTNATSLGGVESLIEHRASVEGAHPVSPPSLLRLSIGLEHPDDLVADLAQALA